MANRLFGHVCSCGNTIQLEKNQLGFIIAVHGGHRMEILQYGKYRFSRFKASNKTIICDKPKLGSIGTYTFERKCGKNIRVSTFKEVIL